VILKAALTLPEKVFVLLTYVPTTLAVPVAEAVKVAIQLELVEVLAVRLHGDPEKLPEGEKLTVPVGDVAPDVAVEVTVAVQVEAWFTTTVFSEQVTVVEVG